MSEQTNATPLSPAITLADLEILSGGASASGITPHPKKAKKKRARKDTRFRCQFRFWLDANKPDQVKLGEALADLKRQRRYLPTLRNAIRLFLDLRAGRTDVLFELFPWIVERLKPATPAPDSGELKREIAGLKQFIMDNMASLPATAIVAAPLKQSGNMGQDKAVVAPTFDDDDEVVMVKRDYDKKPQFESGLLAWIMNPDAQLGGKNLTAEENAKSLAGRRGDR